MEYETIKITHFDCLTFFYLLFSSVQNPDLGQLKFIRALSIHLHSRCKFQIQHHLYFSGWTRISKTWWIKVFILTDWHWLRNDADSLNQLYQWKIFHIINNCNEIQSDTLVSFVIVFLIICSNSWFVSCKQFDSSVIQSQSKNGFRIWKFRQMFWSCVSCCWKSRRCKYF